MGERYRVSGANDQTAAYGSRYGAHGKDGRSDAAGNGCIGNIGCAGRATGRNSRRKAYGSHGAITAAPGTAGRRTAERGVIAIADKQVASDRSGCRINCYCRMGDATIRIGIADVRSAAGYTRQDASGRNDREDGRVRTGPCAACHCVSHCDGLPLAYGGRPGDNIIRVYRDCSSGEAARAERITDIRGACRQWSKISGGINCAHCGVAAAPDTTYGCIRVSVILIAANNCGPKNWRYNYDYVYGCDRIATGGQCV